LELLSRYKHTLAEEYQSLPSSAKCLEPFIDMKIIEVSEARTILNETTDLVCFNTDGFVPDPALLSLFSPGTLDTYNFLPVKLSGNRLTLAMVDPFDLVAIQMILRKGSWDLELQYILYSDFKSLQTRTPLLQNDSSSLSEL
jgi:hypothetical protein